MILISYYRDTMINQWYPIVIKELIQGVSDILHDKIQGTLEETRFGNALQYKFEHTAINYSEDRL